MYRVSPFVSRFAWALLGGAALATLWVNISPSSYYDAIELRLFELSLPHWVSPADVILTPLSLVANLFMAFFLFFIGKELWEALILERGAISGRKQAMFPMALTVGGLIGSIMIWVLMSILFQTAEEAGFASGWSVPMGSDVVVGYIVGRRVFGASHPALHLLLLLTIGTDILALLVMGIAYPSISLRLLWLALPVLASLAVWHFFGRRPPEGSSERRKRATLALWPYLLAGLVSWIGVVASGLPGSLGLLPIIPAIAHADRAFGLFAEAEAFLQDPLNHITHLLVRPMWLVLFLFGLTRGGVDLAAFAPTTLILLASLWIGKPLGMLGGGLILAALSEAKLPQGIQLRDCLLIAVIMGMGFTIPALAIDTTLPGGAMAEAARLGLAISLLAGPFAILLARILKG